MLYTEVRDFMAEHESEPVAFTLNGHTYGFPSSADDLPALLGMRIVEHRLRLEDLRKRIQAGDASAVNDPLLQADIEERVSRGLIPKQVRDQMAENGCTLRQIRHLQQTLLIHYMYGSEVAAMHWEGKLEQATESLGETLAQTENS
ncbi:DUF7426 family protein [Cumulibacter soli]|uniref:DUF7426 family protein n=1 Tax=Cumulibacter soli TaxID=2546344 RepID=UPI00106823FC|nr:hypothetical protein [Cumulibacter soli]